MLGPLGKCFRDSPEKQFERRDNAKTTKICKQVAEEFMARTEKALQETLREKRNYRNPIIARISYTRLEGDMVEGVMSRTVRVSRVMKPLYRELKASLFEFIQKYYWDIKFGDKHDFEYLADRLTYAILSKLFSDDLLKQLPVTMFLVHGRELINKPMLNLERHISRELKQAFQTSINANLTSQKAIRDDIRSRLYKINIKQDIVYPTIEQTANDYGRTTLFGSQTTLFGLGSS